MLNPLPHFLHAHPRLEFKNFNMPVFHRRLEGAKINRARPRRAMIVSWEFDIMDMEPKQALTQRFQMGNVVDEPKVFLNLRMTGVMPIDQTRTRQFLKKR